MTKTIIITFTPFLVFVAATIYAQQGPTAQQVSDRAAALSVSCDGARNALIGYSGGLSDELAKAKSDLAAAQAELAKLKKPDADDTTTTK